jgi:hypothetical protein
MRAGAVPGMGFVTSFRGGSETRPACHDAGLPGAGCPGRGSVVRDHEARDRTELKAARPLARAAVERREASVSAKSGTRRDPTKTGGDVCSAERYLPLRFSALRLPLYVWRRLFGPCQIARAQRAAPREGGRLPVHRHPEVRAAGAPRRMRPRRRGRRPSRLASLAPQDDGIWRRENGSACSPRPACGNA